MRAAAVCYALAVASLSSHAIATDDGNSLMTQGEFRSLVEGKTVHYSLGGEFYGSEHFYGNDRSTWQDTGGACEDGHFWDQADLLCFNYGNTSCWRVFESADGKRKAVSRDGLSVDIYKINTQPLRCGGAPIS